MPRLGCGNRIVLFAALAAATACRATRPAPSAQYVNPAQCAACHPAIAKSYLETGMGRALSRPSPQNTFPERAPDPVYFHSPSQSYFTLTRRDGKYYQRRHQIGFDGKPTNVLEKEIHYVVGSGNQVRTYLHRSADNRLIELPLSWYSEKGGRWLMSPGFDRAAHPGFRRAIPAGCLFCHNGYPTEVPDRRGEDPVFPAPLPEGIDCQRCHGPGSEHIRIAQQSSPDPAKLRATIVNPARLPAERELEVCMQCHLETTSSRLPDSMVRFGRAPFSYQPGEPISNFKLFFDHAPGSGHDAKFEIVGAVYRLRQSACFQKSGGKLLCTSCHNPHQTAGKQLAETCRSCHAAALERMSATKQHSPSADCASCHMPKRRAEDVVHAVITDHLIQRRPLSTNPLADLPERHETPANAYQGEVVPYYPASPPPDAGIELDTAIAQVVQKSNLTEGLSRLSAAIAKHRPSIAEYYLVLAAAYRDAGQLDKAIPQYEEALRRDPTLAAARLQLASALRLARQTARAAEILQPLTDRAAASYELGLIRLDEGNLDQGIAAIERAIAADPDMAEAHNLLAGILLTRGDSARAEASVREAIRIWPEYADAHKNLGALLSARGDLSQACFHLETALRLQPSLTAARYHYALALARMSRFDVAEKQVTQVLHEDPKHAEAHQVLAALLAGKGQYQAAIAEYRSALALRPDFGRALIGLAQVTASMGDRSGAIRLAEQAASSNDSAIRQQAQSMLSQLRR